MICNGVFSATKTEYYHDLAEVLIAQGRLPEAQQVLDFLKDQEYADYVRGEADKNLSPLSLTPAEQQARDDYEKSTAQIVSLGEEWMRLKRLPSRTPEQESRYQQARDKLNDASRGLNDFYARLYTTFSNSSEANKELADVKGNVSQLKQFIAKEPHTVALYTLVGKERYSVIVIAGAATVAREYPITAVELNKKIAQFQQALRDRTKRCEGARRGTVQDSHRADCVRPGSGACRHAGLVARRRASVRADGGSL